MTESYRGSSVGVLDALRDAMRPPVSDRLDPQTPGASALAAGAAEAVGDAAESVAPDPAILDTEPNGLYNDGVEDGPHVERTERRAQAHPSQNGTPSAESVEGHADIPPLSRNALCAGMLAEDREARRRERLQRWQVQR